MHFPKYNRYHFGIEDNRVHRTFVMKGWNKPTPPRCCRRLLLLSICYSRARWCKEFSRDRCIVAHWSCRNDYGRCWGGRSESRGHLSFSWTMMNRQDGCTVVWPKYRWRNHTVHNVRKCVQCVRLVCVLICTNVYIVYMIYTIIAHDKNNSLVFKSFMQFCIIASAN